MHGANIGIKHVSVGVTRRFSLSCQDKEVGGGQELLRQQHLKRDSVIADNQFSLIDIQL